MKKKLYYTLLAVSVALVFNACSNGAYIANPSANANLCINPLNPLKPSQFSWSGTTPVSATINGHSWVADSVGWVLDTGFNYIYAKKGNNVLMLGMRGVYSSSLYSLGYQHYETYAWYTDSMPGSFSSFSYNNPKFYISSLGNSGEVYIAENDSAFIKGEFYFQGKNNKGDIICIDNGYFNIAKP